jgi:serine/threonine-protein kinase
MREIFGQAVSLHPQLRSVHVAWACGSDLDLAREVEALLAADTAHPTGDLLATGMGARLAEEADDGDPTSLVEAGEQLGSYRLLRLLGRGGMGAVHLAIRVDVQKLVAIKVLRGALTSLEGTRRFLLERTLLARLDHPNIARFLDAGVRPDGVPYFVMEYVDGAALGEYARALSLEARIALFDGVCAAVAYAHRHLVVHRDLKPSNILVDRAGVPKLLDFGIAKLLEDREEDVTRAGMPPMTPEYAAPEQFRGEPITPAADVYALGVLLFELLTGERPYSIRGLPMARAGHVVCEAAVPRPSTRVAGGRTAWRHAGDLDAICLRALEKDPERRYPTAAELRADIQRYLSRRPIEARPPTRRYIVRRFLGRHRVAAAFVSIIVALLLGGTATVLWHAGRAEEERVRAEQALRESESVSAFLIDLFEAQNPNAAQGEEPSARELIASGVERAERLTAHPIVQARMFDTIGRLYQATGQLDMAEQLLRRALDVRRSHLGHQHPDTAASLHNLANLLFERGALDEAGRLFEDAVAVRREVLGPHHPELAASLAWHGEFLARVRRDPDRAEPLVREALAIGRQVLSRDDPRMAALLTAMVAVTTARNQPAAAEPLLREALEIQARHLGRTHPDAIVTLNNLGTTLVAKGDFAGGEAALREALDLYRHVLGPTHHNVAIALNNLAALHRKRGRLADAAAAQREAVTMATATLGAQHPTVVRMADRLSQIESLRTRALAAQ